MRNRSQKIPNVFGHIVALVMLGVLLLSSTPVQADSFGLGNAGDYNVMVFGSFSSSFSDTEGSMAVGGSASLNGYAVGLQLGSSHLGASLVVGGSLSYSNGSIYNGYAEVGGAAAVSSVGDGVSSAAVVNSGVSGLSVDFNAEKNAAIALSENLAGLQATGSGSSVYGGIEAVGDNSSPVQVFDIDGSDISNAWGWRALVDVPEDSTLVFNISGKNISMTGGLSELTSFSDRVIFNFFEAETIDLRYLAVEGSILAPYANVTGNSGQMNGTLIANSFTGNLQFNHNPYSGAQFGVSTASTPEPGTMLLMASALGGLLWWRRRQTLATAKVRAAGMVGA